MILQIVHNQNQGYLYQLMEDLEYHLLEEATKEDLLEYKEYLTDQINMVNEILS